MRPGSAEALIHAEAPSNIALIKYMGKTAAGGNRPTNPSLSYTLSHLKTAVTLRPTLKEDCWSPMTREHFAAPQLSPAGVGKFMKHLDGLKRHWELEENFEVLSANNFPSDCGLASSASSFAALTTAVGLAAGCTDAAELSRLSRLGSGSSCRSFYSPWALWEGEGATPIEVGYGPLLHAAVIVSSEIKQVSSSQAHALVPQSPKFAGRPERATARLRELIDVMREGRWDETYRICWDEFVDMHELFESCPEPFRYRTEASEKVVLACKHIWNFKKDGPLVTMDAGPNVHLLFRPGQEELAHAMVRHFRESHVVITSWGGFR